MPMMSGMGGYEVCMKLKQTIETRDIPILMLSARGGDLDNQMGLDSGADAYLGKPYDSKNLLNEVTKLINKK